LDIKINKPPRLFSVGFNKEIKISDCGQIKLQSNEQVTFIEDEKEYDVAKKDWGFYATPSINGRLKSFGYKTALVMNSVGKYYVMIVDKEKMEKFNKYIISEKSSVVQWLDEK
jgi:hypothetical protein